MTKLKAMNKDIKELFWAPIVRHFEEEDDPHLWQLALVAILDDLDCELIWDDMPTPSRVHLVLAKQSNWWKPHWHRPMMYGVAVGGLDTFEPPDWEEHWSRNKSHHNWEYRGASAGKLKGKTSHCLTFFPARTTRHSKASVVQIWKPPISPGKPVTTSKGKDISWYPDGRRYLFERDNSGIWIRKA